MKNYLVVLVFTITANSLCMNPPTAYAKIFVTPVEEGRQTRFQIGVAESKFSKHSTAHPDRPYTSPIDLRQEMMAACILGKDDIVRDIHIQDQKIIDSVCPQNMAWQPLLYAAACGRRSTVETLVALGVHLSCHLSIADGSLRIDENAAALARRCGHTELATYLGQQIQTSKK